MYSTSSCYRFDIHIQSLDNVNVSMYSIGLNIADNNKRERSSPFNKRMTFKSVNQDGIDSGF